MKDLVKLIFCHRVIAKPQCFRSTRASIGLIGLFLASLFTPAAAAEPLCKIESATKVIAGIPNVLKANCNSNPIKSISWRLNNDSSFTLKSSSNSIKINYASPGYPIVTAKIEFPDGQLVSFTEQLQVYPHILQKKAKQTETMVYDSLNGRIWCINPDNNTVSIIDIDTKTKIEEVPTLRGPRSIALHPNGEIWIVCNGGHAIQRYKAKEMTLLAPFELPRASQPYGVLFTPDGRSAILSLEATGQLIQIKTENGQIEKLVETGPSPRAMLLAPDGKTLFVARFLSPANEGQVTQWTIQPLKKIKTISLLPTEGSDGEDESRGVPNYLQHLAMSPDGKTLWISCAKDNTERGLWNEGTIPNFETTVRTQIIKIDVASGTENMDDRVDINDANLQRSVVFIRDGTHAFACALGSSSIDYVNTSIPQSTPKWRPKGSNIPLGPDGMVLSHKDSLLWVHFFLSREMIVFDASKPLGVDTLSVLKRISTVTHEILEPEVLAGKKIFYNSADPRMSKDRYISCASCHLEGDSDGRVWDFHNRGEGLRRTISLKGRGGAGPLHWSANFDEIQDFEHDIRGPQSGTGFLSDQDFEKVNQPLGKSKKGLSKELDALEKYLQSLLEFPESPLRETDGRMTASALRGQLIFNRETVGCYQCHSGAGFTDSKGMDSNRKKLWEVALSYKQGKNENIEALLLPKSALNIPGEARSWITKEGSLLHNVGTQKLSSGHRLSGKFADSCSTPMIGNKKECLQSSPNLAGIDTPTLIGIWDQKRFLHDGSASSLREVLVEQNLEDRHGVTSQLSEREVDDLIQYLLELEGKTDDVVSLEKKPGGNEIQQRNALSQTNWLRTNWDLVGRKIHYNKKDK